MKLALLIIFCASVAHSDDCYYGNDKLFTRNIKNLRLLSNFKQSAIAKPYFSYHYDGRSVSAEQYEKLIQQENQRKLP